MTLFLVVIDAFTASILYYFLKFGGLALGLVLIRILGFSILFPLVFTILSSFIKKDRIGVIYLISFCTMYLLISSIYIFFTPTNKDIVEIFISSHKNLQVYLSIYMPLIISFITGYFIFFQTKKVF